MEKLLKEQEERILQLEATIARKDEEIQSLKSQLDKYRSITRMPCSPVLNSTGPRKNRACGISAEPGNIKVQIKLSNIKKHKKDSKFEQLLEILFF